MWLDLSACQRLQLCVWSAIGRCVLMGRLVSFSSANKLWLLFHLFPVWLVPRGWINKVFLYKRFYVITTLSSCSHCSSLIATHPERKTVNLSICFFQWHIFWAILFFIKTNFCNTFENQTVATSDNRRQPDHWEFKSELSLICLETRHSRSLFKPISSFQGKRRRSYSQDMTSARCC